MAISNLVNNNEENLREAINTGISGEAVSSTLEGIADVSDSYNAVPSQLKSVVEAIVGMKRNIQNSISQESKYTSAFMKENLARIMSALRDGISSNEIKTSLSEAAIDANSKDSKEILKFLVKLISKMKAKQLSIEKKRKTPKGRQMVLAK